MATSANNTDDTNNSEKNTITVFDAARSTSSWNNPDDTTTHIISTQYNSNVITLHNYIYMLTGVPWDVCEWGSCQYSSAYSMYKALYKLKQAKLNPTQTIGWETYESLIKDINPIKTSVNTFILKSINDIPAANRLRPKPRVRETILNIISLCKETTLDLIFYQMKLSSWSLWGAVAYICPIVFKSDIDTMAKVLDSYKAESITINYKTALICYLLVEIGYVTNPNVTFAHFDT